MGKWLTSTETLTFEVRDKVAYITLNRPEKRNAVNMAALVELRAALLEADDLVSVSCVVLAGAGKDFCAGWDLTSDQVNPVLEATASDEPVYRSMTKSLDDDSWQLERILELRMVCFDMHKPVVARVQGNCLANGTDIALMADMVIASHDARIGYPPVRAQGSPASHLWLHHMGPQWAKRMLLTGDLLRGRQAAKLGLVLQSVPEARLDATIADLTRRLTAVHPELLACNKRVVNLGLELMGARTLQRLASELDARGHLSPSRYAFRKDIEEIGLKAAVAKRDAAFGDGEIHLEGELG